MRASVDFERAEPKKLDTVDIEQELLNRDVVGRKYQ